MSLVKLTDGINIGIGWDMYELGHGSAISDVIVDVEKVGSPDLQAKFIPSHTWKVLAIGPVSNWNGTGISDSYGIGIEASTEGVAYFPLSKYLGDPSCEIWSCHPQGLTDESIQIMLSLSGKLDGMKLGYDYSGLIGDAIEGFSGIDRLLPWLNKVSDPLHDDHDLFCSALVSTLNAACPQYAKIPLYQNSTDTKISPEMSMYEFPYDKRVCIKTAA